MGRDLSTSIVAPPPLPISIHAPRVGRDFRWTSGCTFRRHFNPRAPCGARLRQLMTGGGRDISIHAPRVGRDANTRIKLYGKRVFQSTRPVWGATRSVRAKRRTTHEFQSTRPVWGATPAAHPTSIMSRNFNPRAPCGARPPNLLAAGIKLVDFNPRAPCGARRGKTVVTSSGIAISIHAPRVGRDGRAICDVRLASISIHAPRVGRDRGFRQPGCRTVQFQSTRPVWGATGFRNLQRVSGFISIHAPRVGRDVGATVSLYVTPYFNPRAPCGARQ